MPHLLSILSLQLCDTFLVCLLLQNLGKAPYNAGSLTEPAFPQLKITVHLAKGLPSTDVGKKTRPPAGFDRVRLAPFQAADQKNGVKRQQGHWMGKRRARMFTNIVPQGCHNSRIASEDITGKCKYEIQMGRHTRILQYIHNNFW